MSSICILLAHHQFLRGDDSGLTTGAPEPLLSGIGTFAGSDVKRSLVSSADDMREGDLRMAPKCSTWLYRNSHCNNGTNRSTLLKETVFPSPPYLTN